MDIIKLRISNFLTIGDSGELSLKDKGLVLIQGKNEDDSSQTSNGAGKSSIPDALCWALYGTTARGESGDAIINNKAKKNCRVVVTIQDGDTIYEIARHRKDATFKNQTTIMIWNPASGYPTAPGMGIAKGTEAETQLEINRIMGCSLTVFMAAIYAGQELMPDLPRMTDKELKLLVEQGSGIERIEAAYALARAKENDIKLQFSAKNVDVTSLRDSALVRAKASLLAMEDRHATFERQRQPLHEQYKKEALTVGETVKSAIRQLEFIDEAKINAEITALQEQVNQQASLLIQKQHLASAVHNAKHALNAAVAVVTRIEGSIAQHQFQIDNAPEAMKVPCSECGKPHTPEELADFIAHTKGRKEKIAAELSPAKQLADEAKAKFDKACSDHDSFIVPDISDTVSKMSALSKHIETANKIRSLIELRKKDLVHRAEKAKSVLTEVNPHQSGLVLAKSQVEEIERQLKVAMDKAQELESELTVASQVTAVFSPAGVRARILDNVTPFLNRRTSEYLNALSDGNLKATWSTLSTTAKGDLREKFNIEVESATGGGSFGLISGGEKRKVRLAACLALQDLVASRATKPINLWIGDEIDDALDDAGLERLMSILETKARERGTVLIISHNELTDWVDQTATVVKRKGMSTIEGALSA